jgi:transcriptional regulator with XRE-family HTH domain
LQGQFAEQIGVDKTSIYNWEGNRSKPGVHYMQAGIRFLGYNPLPPAKKWADRLVQWWIVLGLSEQSAARIGADPCILARWERGERQPTGARATQASSFVSQVEAAWSEASARTA